MRVGGVETRFLYEGANLVAEFEDRDGDAVPDRKRFHWSLPAVDRPPGFVEVAGDGSESVYHYLTDAVGSVLRIVDASGAEVAAYDYDAFGNLRGGPGGEPRIRQEPTDFTAGAATGDASTSSKE